MICFPVIGELILSDRFVARGRRQSRILQPEGSLMKHLSWFLATLLVLCGCHREDPAPLFAWPASADSLAATLLDSLQVTEIGLRLAESPDEINQQLWRTFANRDPAERYSRIEVPAGVSAWPVFRERLVRVAEAAGRPRPMKARHIQIWAFHIQSGQEVGHVSCK